ncbi:histidine kinase [Streptomyces sp. NPDC005899]|uniref:sensor histidine kinase n=1 Tax=Streptomyces sp. NPDC005899 TaxID=3155716 RepID=UPI00340B5A34
MATSPAGPPPPADGLLSAARRNLRELAHGLSHASHPPTPLFADSPRRWLRLLPYVVVVALTAVLLPVTIVVLTDGYGLSGGVAGALAVGQAAPLLMLVHRPLQAWWIIFAFDVLGALLVQPDRQEALWPWPAPVIVGHLFVLLALGLRERRHTLIGVWLVIGAAGQLLHLLVPSREGGGGLLLFVLGAPVLVIGAAVRERSEAQRLLVEQETISEAERARRTLLEERARIARELHDVVAHHMSVITVQADSAPYRIGGLSDEARAEFASIAAGARESLGEMRRLLSVLRSDGSRGELAPQPGLDRLQQLVEATVRAGVPAELSLAADVRDAVERGGVPQTVDLSAYRIVQEALANVVRHAPGARTRVSVTARDGRLTVLVVNDRAREPGAPLEVSGTGHGLVGMRERVRLTGGTLDTGPLPDGGFRVAARLPLPPDRPPAASVNPEDS